MITDAAAVAIAVFGVTLWGFALVSLVTYRVLVWVLKP